MLVGVIATVTCLGGFNPPQTMRPEETESKGYALLFAESPSNGFELFFKEAGKTWEEVIEAQAAAEKRPDNPWLIFQLESLDMDYFVRVAMKSENLPVAEGRASADFTNYFEPCSPAKPEALNNFGLQDIY